MAGARVAAGGGRPGWVADRCSASKEATVRYSPQARQVTTRFILLFFSFFFRVRPKKNTVASHYHSSVCYTAQAGHPPNSTPYTGPASAAQVRARWPATLRGIFSGYFLSSYCMQHKAGVLFVVLGPFTGEVFSGQARFFWGPNLGRLI